MSRIEVTAVPAEIMHAVSKDRQGTLIEDSYQVDHYINAERQLVTTLPLKAEEVGREVVRGEAIVKKCHVYLPPGYDSNDASKRYPVLYLLHGVGGDQLEWLRGSGMVEGRYILCHLIDNLIASGEIEPLIVVFPNGRASHDWEKTPIDFAGTNVLGFYYFDYELRHNLIPYIEAKYHTRADVKDTSERGIAYNRTQRAIAGLSMGGMQALNLIVGGYRYDSIQYVKVHHDANDVLAATVPAPGMLDLFDYVGAFSNAPTSSEGSILGASLKASDHKLSLLYMTCGDADEISIHYYNRSIAGLLDKAEHTPELFYQVLIQGGVHDFKVWLSGAYHFLRLIFQSSERSAAPEVVQVTLPDEHLSSC